MSAFQQIMESYGLAWGGEAKNENRILIEHQLAEEIKTAAKQKHFLPVEYDFAHAVWKRIFEYGANYLAIKDKELFAQQNTNTEWLVQMSAQTLDSFVLMYVGFPSDARLSVRYWGPNSIRLMERNEDSNHNCLLEIVEKKVHKNKRNQLKSKFDVHYRKKTEYEEYMAMVEQARLEIEEGQAMNHFLTEIYAEIRKWRITNEKEILNKFPVKP